MDFRSAARETSVPIFLRVSTAGLAAGLAAALLVSGCSLFSNDADPVRSGGPGPAPSDGNAVRWVGQMPSRGNPSAPKSGGRGAMAADARGWPARDYGYDPVRTAGANLGGNDWDGPSILPSGDDVYQNSTEGLLQPDAYPANPAQNAQMGVALNREEWTNGLYNPDTASRRMMNASMAGLAKMTFTESGGDHNVSLSPDGRWMYYATTKYGKNPQLVMQPISGRAVTRLTEHGMSDMMPAVSPDGKTLVWCSNRFGNWTLLARDFDAPASAAPQQLTRSDDDDIHPTWSPDGLLLAFARYNAMNAQWELWVMDYVRHTVTCVGPGLFPAFCPVVKRTAADGSPVYTLAYQNHRQRGVPWFSIWTIDVGMRFGKVEPVSAPTEIVHSDQWAAITPAWAPRGDYLAFASVRKSLLAQHQARIYRADDIWVVRSDGGDLTQITDHPAPDWCPYWAPEAGNPAGRIYFTSSRDGNPTIWSVRPQIPGLAADLPDRGGRVWASGPGAIRMPDEYGDDAN